MAGSGSTSVDWWWNFLMSRLVGSAHSITPPSTQTASDVVVLVVVDDVEVVSVVLGGFLTTPDGG